MTREQRKQCNTIIHTASVAAGAVGAGTAQIPMADSAAIVPIQLGMTLALAKVFGVNLNSAAVKSALASKLATVIGQTAAAALPGMIPIAGNLIKASVAAGVTETMGWMMANGFDEGMNGQAFDEQMVEKILESIE